MTVCVFLGASSGKDESFAVAASDLGKALAEANWPLVYGGSTLGLMGYMAQSCLTAGGQVVGIIPESLHARVRHPALTELLVVGSMHERKSLMHERADAFVLFPGGIGSLEEFFEAFTWLQLGYHRKPVIVADIGGFYHPLLNLLAHLRDQGFVAPAVLDRLKVARDVQEVMSFLDAGSPATA